MRRRDFITMVGGAAAAWPLAARAQQPGRTYRLGFFLPVARDAPAMIAFFDELRLHGFVEGQNLAVLPGGFQAGNERIDDLVPTLVKAEPDAIPIPLCLCKTPASTIPRSGSIAGGMAPDYLSPQPVEGSM